MRKLLILVVLLTCSIAHAGKLVPLPMYKAQNVVIVFKSIKGFIACMKEYKYNGWGKVCKASTLAVLPGDTIVKKIDGYILYKIKVVSYPKWVKKLHPKVRKILDRFIGKIGFVIRENYLD